MKLLEWLADEDRVLITHDVRTMPKYVYQRLDKGQKVVGIIVVHQDTPIRIALEELELYIELSEPSDFSDPVKYINRSND